MQDERSQHQVKTPLLDPFTFAYQHNSNQNKRRAFTVLRSRLMDLKLTQEIAQRRATRQNLVHTADRSEKIRTYNYAQVNSRLKRVTRH